MKPAKGVVMMLGLTLMLTAVLWAQRPGRGGMGMTGGGAPPMPGLRNAAIGSGAEYQMSAKGKDMDIAFAIVGKEDVGGHPGYWVEMRMNNPDLGGEMVTKSLTVTEGPEVGVKRMIMQAPGRPPMEMSGMMMGMQQRQQQPSGKGGAADMGELVGTESVTVPAGTFSCQHYRKQGQNGPVDYWITMTAGPYGLVKMTSADATMVLKKILTNETSRIKGEPQKMNVPKMEMPHF